jgi:predicted nuclease of restriction endonuclease-like (RecB) superfamily
MEKSKNITLLDQDYLQWVKELSTRYRRSQIKAAVKVNEEMLQFYWELGRDIVEMHVEERWGEGVMKALSTDLQKLNPTAHCFSRTNLYYVKKFYLTYSSYTIKIPQLGGQIEKIPQLGGQITQHIEENAGDANTPQVVEQIKRDIMSIGWGHHKLLMDKCSDNPQKAIFFVHQTVLNGWSRSMLLNFLDTDLYERQGKALTNFSTTLPEETSDLAQELTKDPYDFAFTGITGRYNERLLKDKLLSNITQFMVELGTGFAYVGKEYRLQVGEREQFIDLLFYNLNLSCYVVVEVKIGKFEFADVGQLGGYVVSCNHLLRKEGRDNPTIGLLICKEKDRIQAQYALESSSQPLGISEYDLEKFYPEKVEGTIPTIEEIERQLERRMEEEKEDGDE